jgi:hypothetical protein
LAAFEVLNFSTHFSTSWLTLASFSGDGSPDAETKRAVIEVAASAKGDGPPASESGTYALAAWVRYPTEYSERIGSILGRKDLISDSMTAVRWINIEMLSIMIRRQLDARFSSIVRYRSLYFASKHVMRSLDLQVNKAAKRAN